MPRPRVAPSALEIECIRRDRKLLRLLRKISTGMSREVLPLYGMCRAVSTNYGCAFFLHHGRPYIVGVRGWFDGKLIECIKLLEVNKFATAYDEKPLFMAAIIDKQHGNSIELIREWSPGELRAQLKKVAVAVTDGAESFFHIPFWRTGEPIILPPTEVMEEDSVKVIKSMRLPFIHKKTGTYLHIGELITDTYGVAWEVTGCSINTEPMMIEVKNCATGTVLQLLPSAMGTIKHWPLPQPGEDVKRAVRHLKHPRRRRGT